MKKITHIAALLVYLPAILGMGFNVHYCAGEVESVKVFAIEEEGCCCGDESSNGCCDDERSYVKLDENSQVSPTVSQFKTNATSSQLLVFTVAHAPSNFCTNYSLGITTYKDTGPPRQSVPVYLQNRILII